MDEREQEKKMPKVLTDALMDRYVEIGIEAGETGMDEERRDEMYKQMGRIEEIVTKYG